MDRWKLRGRLWPGRLFKDDGLSKETDIAIDSLLGDQLPPVRVVPTLLQRRGP
jgi:hypothetical protein